MTDFPDIGVAIRELLARDAKIKGLVSGRIFADQMPQSLTPPAITYWVISEEEEDDLSGPTGFAQSRLQVDCYGQTRPAAVQLSRLVRSVLAGFRGVVGGVVIRSITQATGQQYIIERAASGSDDPRRLTSQDFFVHYLSNQKVQT